MMRDFAREAGNGPPLPIDKFRKKIVDSVRDHRVTILLAETGSGKSTQVARFLAEDLKRKHVKTIACTQPRKIAAISLANFVASKVNQHKVGKVMSWFGNLKKLKHTQPKVVYTTDNSLVTTWGEDRYCKVLT
jgi:HrpA-like RNA helicase